MCKRRLWIRGRLMLIRLVITSSSLINSNRPQPTEKDRKNQTLNNSTVRKTLKYRWIQPTISTE